MKIYDLSHTIAADMPVYPGTQPPELTTEATLEKNRFVERRLTLSSHTGTHMDAPAHIFAEGRVLDDYPVADFCGSAFILDVSEQAGAIPAAVLLTVAKEIRQCSFLLLHTGWSRHWGSQSYFSGYPFLSEAAALWLCDQRLKGVGVDAISVDNPESPDFPVHRTLLGSHTLIIENLTNLAPLIGKTVQLFCLPLKLDKAEGAPVRAIALTSS
jgi:arylformamidase